MSGSRPAGSDSERSAWFRLRQNRFATVSAVTLVVITVACLFGPLLSPYDAMSQNLDLGATPPSMKHWFGTDQAGRDMLTRVLIGGRISIAVGIVATFVAVVIGVIYGAVAGFLGGLTDRIMMRLVDMLYALPFPIFVILLVSLFGRKLVLVFLAIGFVQWLTLARIVRGQVQSLRDREFVQAARVLGTPNWRIILRHIIPNIIGPVIVYTTLLIPNVILLESFLSFLGLGTADVSWGHLIKTGADTFEEHIWRLLFPALALASTLFCLNLLGDGLRDAFDPQMKT